MQSEVRIYVNKYLDFLNEEVDHLVKFHKLDPKTFKKTDIKTIAANIGAFEITIENLSNYSSYVLIWEVCSEILDAYWGYFDYDYKYNVKEYPDEMISPRDVNWVIHYLCDYYNAASKFFLFFSS